MQHTNNLVIMKCIDSHLNFVLGSWGRGLRKRRRSAGRGRAGRSHPTRVTVTRRLLPRSEVEFQVAPPRPGRLSASPAVPAVLVARCRCPPLKVTPSLPTKVFKPLGNDSMSGCNALARAPMHTRRLISSPPPTLPSESSECRRCRTRAPRRASPRAICSA